MAAANTLAYYDTATITAIKSFIVLPMELILLKLFGVNVLIFVI